MKVEIKVEYTEEEINHMFGTLKFLSDISDEHFEALQGSGMYDKVSRTFEYLADLLRLDPKGERLYNSTW